MGATKWLWDVALKKGLKRIVQLLVAYLAALGINETTGVSIDTDKLTVATFGALEVLRNYLKVKRGVNWL